MKNKLFKNIVSICITIVFLFLAFGSGVDINDENAVKKDMQGTWVGYSHDGIGEYQYNHYKVVLSGNQFKGWLEVGRTSDEPQWNNNPDVTGDWSLSEVLTYTNADSRYRNIYFEEDESDNLLKARVLQNCIVYDGGLYVVGWGRMSKK
jgi:hypothetical protein